MTAVIQQAQMMKMAQTSLKEDRKKKCRRRSTNTNKQTNKQTNKLEVSHKNNETSKPRKGAKRVS